MSCKCEVSDGWNYEEAICICSAEQWDYDDAMCVSFKLILSLNH